MRDIDDWMFHFERQVSPKLKELFGLDLRNLPPELASRLEKLKQTDTKPEDIGAAKKPTLK